MMWHAFLACSTMLVAADDSVSLMQWSAAASKATANTVASDKEARTTYYPMTWHEFPMGDLQYNNMGGGGPGTTTDPQEMRFRNASYLHTPTGDESLDLVITPVGPWYSSTPATKLNGVNGEFGIIFPKKDQAQRLLFSLVYTGTYTTAPVAAFNFTVLDIDGLYCDNEVVVWSANGYYTIPTATSVMGVTSEHFADHAVGLTACSNYTLTDNGVLLNPTQYYELNHAQARVSVAYHFENVSEFEMGLVNERANKEPFLFGGGSKPLETEQVVWHDFFLPVVPPTIIPGHGQLFKWNLDRSTEDSNFTYLTANNLGGRGPNFDDPPEIRYTNVGNVYTYDENETLYNTSMLDLVVTTADPYFVGPAVIDNWNGANGEYGEIGVDPFSQVTLSFTFVEHGTYKPVVVPAFDFTLFDIDNMADPSLGEVYCVKGAAEYATVNESMTIIDDSVPGQLKLTANVTIQDGAIDNPESWTNLTDEQAMVAVQFRFYDTATWDVLFKSTASLPRALLFGGQSRPPLTDIGTTRTIATLAPTVYPTASPTVPTAAPTVYPTASPTVPTAWPTVYPTASPTVYPTASPTVKPPSTVFGDPHVKNVAGDAFDIAKAAIHTFLLIPRSAKGKDVQLKLRGKVSARGDPCAGQMYLTQLNITGQWLGSVERLELSTDGEGFNTPEAVGLKVGDSGNLSVEEFSSKFPPKMANVTKLSPMRPTQLNKHVTTLLLRLYLGPTILRLSWEHQKEKFGYSNSLMLLSYGLGNVPGEVGGLLGGDDHVWAASKPEECDGASSLQTLIAQEVCCVRAAAFSSAE